MEKYCKSCEKVFNDLNFKLCPYCGSELATRYGRQPIPRKLRHEVFKRDGYRCRECGATKDEASLEIDHIFPVAKGGTNDIDNLQTLCRECNRMKHTDEWVGGETDLEIAQNELRNLEEQLYDAEEGLKGADTEDEKIDYQFRIMKLNEKIPSVKNKIFTLEQEKIKRIELERERKREKERKNKLFKKLYVQLDENTIIYLSKRCNIPYVNKDSTIKYLISNFSETEIMERVIKKDSYENLTNSNLEDGDIGMIISGRLKGQRAKVIRIMRYTNDVEILLIDAPYQTKTYIKLNQIKKV